jgi:hypothetical protein
MTTCNCQKSQINNCKNSIFRTPSVFFERRGYDKISGPASEDDEDPAPQPDLQFAAPPHKLPKIVFNAPLANCTINIFAHTREDLCKGVQNSILILCCDITLEKETVCTHFVVQLTSVFLLGHST